MSERDGFQAGVPCWVAAVLPDPEAGVAFYTELFGWEAADIMPPDGPGRYYVCTLGGRAVAAVGSGRGGQAPDVPAWGTYIWVDSADATATQAAEAGGSVLAAPFDLLDAGRLAVLADPAGAVFCAFEPGRLRGAQVVNQPGAWAMSTLATPDPDSATAFYGSLFGADVVGVMLPQDPGDPHPTGASTSGSPTPPPRRPTSAPSSWSRPSTPPPAAPASSPIPRAPPSP